MTVAPLPLRGGVQLDRREAGRVVRVAAHPETGSVTLSVWRDDRCVASHQMDVADVPQLVAMLTDALAACAEVQTAASSHRTGVPSPAVR